MTQSEVFDATVATEQYLQTLTEEQKENSDAYFEGGYWLDLWDLLIGFVIALVFLSFGLSRLIKNIAEKIRNVHFQNFIYLVLYFLFSYILVFPFTIFRGFFREHNYGLSNMDFGGWFSEEMIGLALTLFFGSIFIAFLYWVISKVKQTWWIWGSTIMVVFMVFSMIISPVFISPLFNEYKPLEDQKIKEEILSMARANGVPADNVYQFDASKQSNRISANVSGFGGTTRVSLNDNLLNQCSSAEIKAVMAHELGHYVLNHIYEMLIYIAILIFIGMAFVNWAFNKLITRFKKKWAIAGISDIVGFPLIVFLFSAFFFIASPVMNNIIRSNEVEADIFGLNTAREPDGFASVAMKLSTYRKISPGKLEEIVFFDHPSGKTRVYNAMIWKAEHLDEE
ncbi:MAG: peptidase M48 [Bacteroidetes bacterium GWF2_33_16]|nr:MAG: peptidase M48 [Bacteroidetes bacterium GWE2_32_14]OFY08934.1 MAG: peptidase M48 [Bacteroidetes bacterium GWF2_33_16]